MKCPLYYIGRTAVLPREEGEIGECLEGLCAWWHTENNRCAILTLAQGITYLHKVALDIGVRLPHEAQFRR